MTDIAEMKITQSGKAKAPTKAGAKGYALGVLIVSIAENKAEREEKERETMKATLKRVQGLDQADHVAFRAELQDTLTRINNEALSLGVTTKDYRKASPKADSIVVTVSLWRKMSSAIECGLDPDYSQSWAQISMAATEQNNSKASPGEDGVTHASPTAKGRKAVPVTDKIKKQLEQLLLDNRAAFLEVAAWMETTVKHMPVDAPL